MKLNIRGDKVTVTKSIKDYIEDKMSRLDKYFDNAKTVEGKIIIRVRNLDQIIEVTIPTSRFTLRAEEKDQDLYAAIDLVVDKLEGQIRKNKTRLNNKYKNLDKFEMSFDFEVADDEIDETTIVQMELLNHDFFVFRNIDEECVSVLYKRKDQSLGIINVK